MTSRLPSIILLVAALVFVAGCNQIAQRESPDIVDSTNQQTVEEATSEPSDKPVETTTNSDPQQTELPAVRPPTGEITLWHSWAQQDGDALNAILEGFQEQYPAIQVNTLFVSQNDLLQSYAQAVANGSGPDMILAPNWWLQDLQTLGAVAPLTDPNYSTITSALWPAAVDNLRIGDELYGIPVNYETVALLYSKSLLPESGLPSTLSELVELAMSSTEYGIGLYANPFHLTWGFPAFGSQVFDANGHVTLGDSAGAAQFLRLLTQIDELEGSFVSDDYGMLLDRFKKGEFAFFVDGPWVLSDLQQVLGDDLGVTTIPPGPAGASRPWLYADAVYVHPQLDAGKVALTALFIEHLTSSDSGQLLAQIANRLPANRAVSLTHSAHLAGFAEQALFADGMRHGPEMDAFWRYGGDMILKSLAGQQDTQTIVDGSTALINDATGK